MQTKYAIQMLANKYKLKWEKQSAFYFMKKKERKLKYKGELIIFILYI